MHEWCCPSCGATTRARMADQSEVAGLPDDGRVLLDGLKSDAIHRAGFPRSTVREAYGESVVGLMTRHATALADARCGIAPDTPSGPAVGTLAARGSLRWYRHYIAELDAAADELTPAWRRAHRSVGPSVWAAEMFGAIDGIYW